MDLHVVSRGTGRPVLLIHGSAVDHMAWSVQLGGVGGLTRELALIAYDRRGTGLSPELAAGDEQVGVHARDAAAVIRACFGEAALVVGSSFGAVVALELARREPALVRGLVLCEPPLPPADDVPPAPDGMGCEMDRLIAQGGGEAAGAFFLQAVLGDDFARMKESFRRRSAARWRAIRADCLALARYRIGYADLADEVAAPVQLVGGGRSGAFYADALDALQLAIPGAARHVFPSAGHMLHVEAHRRFAELLRAAAGDTPPAASR